MKLSLVTPLVLLAALPFALAACSDSSFSSSGRERGNSVNPTGDGATDDGSGGPSGDPADPSSDPSSDPSTTPSSDPTTTPTADAGSDASTPPPNGEPFRRIDLRYLSPADNYIVQCKNDAEQLVWQTLATGPDDFSRWGVGKFSQTPGVQNVSPPCGTQTDGHYPIVLRSWAAGEVPVATYVVKCVAKGVGEVYQVDSAIDGNPAATFKYPEKHPTCE